MSVPQIPQAATRNSSSPSPISGIGTDSTTTCPLPRYTPARMCPRSGWCARCDPMCSMVWLICFKLSPTRAPLLRIAVPASEIFPIYVPRIYRENARVIPPLLCCSAPVVPDPEPPQGAMPLALARAEYSLVLREDPVHI